MNIPICGLFILVLNITLTLATSGKLRTRVLQANVPLVLTPQAVLPLHLRPISNANAAKVLYLRNLWESSRLWDSYHAQWYKNSNVADEPVQNYLKQYFEKEATALQVPDYHTLMNHQWTDTAPGVPQRDAMVLTPLNERPIIYPHFVIKVPKTDHSGVQSNDVSNQNGHAHGGKLPPPSFEDSIKDVNPIRDQFPQPHFGNGNVWPDKLNAPPVRPGQTPNSQNPQKPAVSFYAHPVRGPPAVYNHQIPTKPHKVIPYNFQHSHGGVVNPGHDNKYKGTNHVVVPKPVRKPVHHYRPAVKPHGGVHNGIKFVLKDFLKWKAGKKHGLLGHKVADRPVQKDSVKPQQYATPTPIEGANLPSHESNYPQRIKFVSPIDRSSSDDQIMTDKLGNYGTPSMTTLHLTSQNAGEMKSPFLTTLSNLENTRGQQQEVSTTAATTMSKRVETSMETATTPKSTPVPSDEKTTAKNNPQHLNNLRGSYKQIIKGMPREKIVRALNFTNAELGMNTVKNSPTESTRVPTTGTMAEAPGSTPSRFTTVHIGSPSTLFDENKVKTTGPAVETYTPQQVATTEGDTGRLEPQTSFTEPEQTRLTQDRQTTKAANLDNDGTTGHQTSDNTDNDGRWTIATFPEYRSTFQGDDESSGPTTGFDGTTAENLATESDELASGVHKKDAPEDGDASYEDSAEPEQQSTFPGTTQVSTTESESRSTDENDHGLSDPVQQSLDENDDGSGDSEPMTMGTYKLDDEPLTFDLSMSTSTDSYGKNTEVTPKSGRKMNFDMDPSNSLIDTPDQRRSDILISDEGLEESQPPPSDYLTALKNALAEPNFSVDSVIPMVSPAVDDIRKNNIDSNDLTLLAQAFGDYWPQILELAKDSDQDLLPLVQMKDENDLKEVLSKYVPVETTTADHKDAGNSAYDYMDAYKDIYDDILGQEFPYDKKKLRGKRWVDTNETGKAREHTLKLNTMRQFFDNLKREFLLLHDRDNYVHEYDSNDIS